MRLERIWLIIRQDSQISRQEAKRCFRELDEQGVHVVVAESGLTSNPFPGLLASEPEIPDLAIILGGDGTVLGAARHLAPLQIPLLCFNVGGNLGFLTHEKLLLRGYNSSDASELWTRLRHDQFALERRMMLSACIDPGDGVFPAEGTPANQDAHGPHTALNDFYFKPCQDDQSPTCQLELEIDGEVVDQYQGDGLIIATPTGSTGYSMAAGGPILHPGIEAMVINPICPMSLSSRAVVVPPRARLTVWPLGESSRRVSLWKDGAHATVLETGDRCVVQRSESVALMVVLDQSPSYYRTLTHKLHWAGSLTSTTPSPN
ncbi:MAG: NAD(+) kinase [Cyanobacteriota bacterium]|nr:NAD(+) kinase [Cyanobacteriota bacterium]